ncbi:hypothetical protein GWG65_16605 [Bradyrhizobium sp. CSA207]|nr:hypothetical protein [Bradyrhizobium sp. CSA207]
MLRVSGVSSKSCRSCLESELRPEVQNALVSATALYRAWGRVGLSAMRPSGFVMTMILIGLGAGGCSFSRSESSAYAKADDSDLTGSIVRAAKEAAPTETDLAFARNAASDVLSQGDKDSSQHWENPQTGARGSVTPIAQSYAAEDGRKCRDFLASYVNGSTESWLQGAGCQSSRGRWEIHTLKPWRS